MAVGLQWHVNSGYPATLVTYSYIQTFLSTSPSNSFIPKRDAVQNDTSYLSMMNALGSHSAITAYSTGLSDQSMDIDLLVVNPTQFCSRSLP